MSRVIESGMSKQTKAERNAEIIAKREARLANLHLTQIVLAPEQRAANTAANTANAKSFAAEAAHGRATPEGDVYVAIGGNGVMGGNED